MSERDELRKRLNLVLVGTVEARCADDGDGHTDAWVTGIEAAVDAVLAEIERIHVLVEKPTGWDPEGYAECPMCAGDCVVHELDYRR